MANHYVDLAKKAIDHYLKTNKTLNPPENLPIELKQKKSGVFVTLETGPQHKLRGCIGTYLPTKSSVAEEIIANAIAAATEDYRFSPLTPDELANLHINVSILHEPEQIKSMKDLDVKKYGVIVKSNDGRTGLLLPDIDTVNTPEKQVTIAAQKGGIDLAKDNIYMYRFAVDKETE